MCLYPKLVKNPKYRETKKNGGIIPSVSDPRVLYVPIGCGNCMECRKQKARDWQVRLLEEIKTNTNGKFITLTFSNQSIKELTYNINNYNYYQVWKTNIITRKQTSHRILVPQQRNIQGYALDNEIATRAVRYFLERYRKQTGESLRHWLVTELGHNGTENIHLHGIVWSHSLELLNTTWLYGHIWKGETKQGRIINYVNDTTIGYITKYVHKTDQKHPNYKSIILTSAGIGKNYINTYNAKLNKFNNKETIETYRTKTGHKLALPIYYRNKLYTDDQKEHLWLNKLDKQKRYVNKIEIDISKGMKEYTNAIIEARKLNIELGYNINNKYNQKEYEHQQRILQQSKRLS